MRILLTFHVSLLRPVIPGRPLSTRCACWSSGAGYGRWSSCLSGARAARVPAPQGRASVSGQLGEIWPQGKVLGSSCGHSGSITNCRISPVPSWLTRARPWGRPPGPQHCLKGTGCPGREGLLSHPCPLASISESCCTTNASHFSLTFVFYSGVWFYCDRRVFVVRCYVQTVNCLVWQSEACRDNIRPLIYCRLT